VRPCRACRRQAQLAQAEATQVEGAGGVEGGRRKEAAGKRGEEGQQQQA